ncbi:MAG: MipA/OmpV family protein, partial [Planctomycetes bacterium]|nr:MipA/OmpV family protein [Planctomycetota bacterium]
LDIGAGMGWGSSEYNRFYYGGSPRNPGAAMTDVRASLSLPFGLCECGACGWTLVPMLMYSSILDKDLRHNHSQEDSSLFWGVSLSIPF